MFLQTRYHFITVSGFANDLTLESSSVCDLMKLHSPWHIIFIFSLSIYQKKI